MRILALSDVPRWEGYEKLVDTVAPDVVVLPGDLVADGFLDRRHILQHVPAYKSAYENLVREYGAKVKSDGGTTILEAYTRAEKGFVDAWKTLVDQYSDTPEFDEALVPAHLEPFYGFLAHAGKRCPVLITKGDHDDDIPENYQVQRINEIPGCQEISGQQRTVNGVAFLGLGFDHADKPSHLQSVVAEFAGKADVVVCHAPQKMVPRVADALKPRLLVRGHHGNGHYLVNGVPSVFTQNAHHTIIDYQHDQTPRIQQFSLKTGKDGQHAQITDGNCAPWMDRRSQWEIYPWLKPYPNGARAA